MVMRVRRVGGEQSRLDWFLVWWKAKDKQTAKTMRTRVVSDERA